MRADIHNVPQSYGIARWGEGYFGINSEGHLTVRPDRAQETQVDLYRLALEMRDQGLHWPVLVRFTDILHDRIRTLCSSFRQAFAETGYDGRYTAVYPIKVNQQRSVVEELLIGGDGCIGLEAGSKPELMAVLSMVERGPRVIVCNGYKDREYIRLALIGSLLVERLFIVIEKPSELELVEQEAADLGIEPRLGVRVRLASLAAGKWQNSGGSKSKFGLSAGQILALVERLQGGGRLGWLQLLHSHMGSQIPNLRDIRHAMSEVAQFYTELRLRGAPIGVVDVGGGLGVDYEGTATRHFCSTNYGLTGYAKEIAAALGERCQEEGMPHPEIFSESGRAMTAHHALLIANVIEHEAAPGAIDPDPASAAPHRLFREFAEAAAQVGETLPLELYHEARHLLDEAIDLFNRGELDLPQRALAEQYFYSICRRLRPSLRAESRHQRELLDELNSKLADKLFCNFSLFQSLPDVWAIDQVFPVAPLQRLNEAPERNAVIHDLTCDSDGCINQYPDQDGVESTLPVHELAPDETYLIGMFLVGAYQEILGDMHNLFGDTNAVNLELDDEGGYRLAQAEWGDSVNELLSYVHFDPRAMLPGYRRSLERRVADPELREGYYEELRAGLFGYSYLEE